MCERSRILRIVTIAWIALTSIFGVIFLLALFLIATPSIDLTTATLFTAVLALSGSLIVTVLNATVLETRKRRIEIETEKKALREALYSEIGWALKQMQSTMRMIGGDINIHEKYKERGLFWLTSWESLSIELNRAISFDVYDAARKSPALFYQLQDAKGIDNFFQTLRGLLREIDLQARMTPEGERGEQGEKIADYIENTFKFHLEFPIRKLDIDELRDVTISKQTKSATFSDAKRFLGELGFYSESVSEAEDFRDWSPK